MPIDEEKALYGVVRGIADEMRTIGPSVRNLHAYALLDLLLSHGEALKEHGVDVDGNIKGTLRFLKMIK